MINNEWDDVLAEEFKKDYFLKIKEFIDDEYSSKTVYPPYDEIFNAFKLTSLSDVRVVILGQDPYHEEGQAHGLAFSTPHGRPIPRSLKNIFKEINEEYSYPIPESGCLENWAKHCFNRRKRKCKLTQQMRMANIYRQCDKNIKQSKSAYCIFTLGKTG